MLLPVYLSVRHIFGVWTMHSDSALRTMVLASLLSALGCDQHPKADPAHASSTRLATYLPPPNRRRLMQAAAGPPYKPPPTSLVFSVEEGSFAGTEGGAVFFPKTLFDYPVAMSVRVWFINESESRSIPEGYSVESGVMTIDRQAPLRPRHPLVVTLFPLPTAKYILTDSTASVFWWDTLLEEWVRAPYTSIHPRTRAATAPIDATAEPHFGWRFVVLRRTEALERGIGMFEYGLIAAVAALALALVLTICCARPRAPQGGAVESALFRGVLVNIPLEARSGQRRCR